MALVEKYIGAFLKVPQQAERCLFQHSGNLYIVLSNLVFFPPVHIRVLKSTDQGDTWSFQDYANSPTINNGSADAPWYAWSCVMSGSNLWIAYTDPSYIVPAPAAPVTGDEGAKVGVSIIRFSMTTDTWDIASIIPPRNLGATPPFYIPALNGDNIGAMDHAMVHLARRSDGTFVAFYTDASYTYVSGDGFTKRLSLNARYAVYDPGTGLWSDRNTVQAGTAAPDGSTWSNYRAVHIVPGGSDLLHLFFDYTQYRPDNVNITAPEDNSFSHVSLSSSGVLGSQQVLSSYTGSALGGGVYRRTKYGCGVGVVISGVQYLPFESLLNDYHAGGTDAASITVDVLQSLDVANPTWSSTQIYTKTLPTNMGGNASNHGYIVFQSGVPSVFWINLEEVNTIEERSRYYRSVNVGGLTSYWQHIPKDACVAAQGVEPADDTFGDRFAFEDLVNGVYYLKPTGGGSQTFNATLSFNGTLGVVRVPAPPPPGPIGRESCILVPPTNKVVDLRLTTEPLEGPPS